MYEIIFLRKKYKAQTLVLQSGKKFQVLEKNGFRKKMFFQLELLEYANFVVIISRSRLVWFEWSIKIIHKHIVIFKNKTYILKRRIFSVLFVQGILST